MNDCDPPWETATEGDFEIAVQNALRRAGCDFHELVAMATCGEFESVRAKMAWVAIGDLAVVRDHDKCPDLRKRPTPLSAAVRGESDSAHV